MDFEESVKGKEFSEEHKTEMESSYGKAKRDLQMAIDVGAYVISDDVVKILTELQSESRKKKIEKDSKVPKEDDFGRYYEMFLADAEAYPKALAEIARNDAKIG